MGRIVSINVGLPREIDADGMTVRTSIFKEPVEGPVRVTRLNLDGDRQSDLAVHGGVDKAVYAYPSEHYALWRTEFPGQELPWGAFGENLTTEGLGEASVHIGDRLGIGTAAFVVTQPRMPCYKLGIRFGRPDMVKRFLESGRSGFYLRVAREGEIEAGDTITVVERHPAAVPVAEIAELYTAKQADPDRLRRVVALEPLPQSWRDWFRKKLPK
jgi:MOSC domain-containing protein YiiM